jgi:CRP/FNR family transcriptional regulator, cyclic AMP receptor protein
MPSPLAAASSRSAISTRGFLATATAGLRDALLAAGRFREIAVGEVFNVAGDEEAGIWGVATGQVALISAINAPDSPALLLFHPGDWGGWAPLFGYPRMANVLARTPTVILFVPFHDIRRILAANPGWWADIAKVSFDYSTRYAAFAVDLLLRDSRQRAAAILLHQAGARQSGDEAITLILTQEELGEMMNLSRHPTGAMLRDLEAQGLIVLGYRQLTLLRPAALRTIANGD